MLSKDELTYDQLIQLTNSWSIHKHNWAIIPYVAPKFAIFRLKNPTTQDTQRLLRHPWHAT